MNENLNDQDVRNNIAARFQALPKVVQDSILSADVEMHMRELADTHKLHFDQWSSLENEVMLALLGLEPAEKLAENLQTNVQVGEEVAHALADSILHTVFEPIRAELEKNLEYPATDTAETNPGAAPAASQAAVAPTPIAPASAPRAAATEDHPLAQIVPAIAPIMPGTPPPPPPEKKAVRAPLPEGYSVEQGSHERKTAEGDPYRESAI